MADCGAGGTTLDRTVESLWGSSNNVNPKATAAIRSLLGHASQSQPHQATMPLTTPTELTLSSPPAPQQQQQQIPLSFTPQQIPTTTTATRANPSVLIPIQQKQLQRSNQMHQIHHPGILTPHHQHQQMMMMHSMMMEQQQQLSQMVQQQQQLRQQQQQQSEQKELLSNFSLPHDLLDEQQLKAEIYDHLSSLEGGGERIKGQDYYNEGYVQGASIEELAAAWQQAEAEYSQEMYDSVDDAVNLAAPVVDGDRTLNSYQFINPAEYSETNHADWMEEGMRQFRTGNLPEAIRAFEMELQIGNPNNAKAWSMLGKCHAENDQDREAITCLEHAVDRDPYSQEAMLDLGVSYVNELDHNKALETLMSWITNNPKYAGMKLSDDLYGSGGPIAESHHSDPAFEEVQRLLLRALEYDPSADVWQALGVVYNVSRHYDAAVDSLEKALQLSPQDYQLWNKLGATLANSNRSEQALPAYHKAIAIKPKYARAWLNMAISHSNLNNYYEAARCYLQTLSLNPGAVHCWNYLRIALSCAERFDLIPLVSAQDLVAFQEHFDFVLYNHPK